MTNTKSFLNIKQGDCLELMKELESQSIDLILCDLPYGTTACSWDTIISFDKLWVEYKRIIKGDAGIILFGTQPFTSILINSNLKMFRYELIWDKIRAAGFLNANKMPLKQHEDICVFYKSQPTYHPQKVIGKPYDKTKYNGNKLAKNVLGAYTSKSEKNNGERFPKSILTFSQNWKRQDQLHPTQKPIALLEYLIKTYSNKGDTILDNCMGVGSTGLACKNTERNFIGYELDEKYFKIAESRLL